MYCNTSSRRRLSFSFTAVHLIQFPSDLFSAILLELSVPVSRGGKIINISLILYHFAQRLLTKSNIFPKYSSLLCFIGLTWTVGYTGWHCPHGFWWYCCTLSVSVSFQETDINTDKMNVEYGQKAPSISISDIEHMMFDVSLLNKVCCSLLNQSSSLCLCYKNVLQTFSCAREITVVQITLKMLSHLQRNWISVALQSLFCMCCVFWFCLFTGDSPALMCVVLCTRAVTFSKN